MSQASVKCKRPRQNNFSTAELALLADEVNEHSRILFGAFSSTVTNQSKNKVWEEIATKLSACSSTSRSGAQIRKKWNDYKSQVKRKAIDVRRERSKTGGGSAPEPLSDLESKVVSLIPSCQIEGIIGGLETDEFPETSMNESEVETEVLEATQLIELSEASKSCLPEESITDLQSELISVPCTSSTQRTSINVPPVKKQKTRLSTDRTRTPPQHVSSLLDIESDKRAIMKEILATQKEMLLLRREEVALNRERLALEKEKWEHKKPTYTPNSLCLSPVIKF